VLLAGLESDVVPVAVLAIGNGRIVLFQARNDLGVDIVFQRFDGCEVLRMVGILCLEIRQNLGVGACVVAEPIVGVRALAVRRRHRMRADGGDGGL
jgi:hypothetical protein